jgi:hypothetical protein
MEGSDPFKKRGNTAGTTVKIMHRNCWIGMSHVPGEEKCSYIIFETWLSCVNWFHCLPSHKLSQAAYKTYDCWKERYLSYVVSFLVVSLTVSTSYQRQGVGFLSFFCLRSVYYGPCLCLLIVHSWLFPSVFSNLYWKHISYRLL